MEAEVIVYLMTLFFGVATFIIIKKKRFVIAPFLCFDIVLTFIGFAVTSCVMLFAPDEDLEILLFMGVLGMFLFLLGMNDIYSVLRCKQKIEAVYCGCNSYPGRYGITSYAPVFEYVCGGTVYHEQTTQNVSGRVIKNMTEGESYPIYVNSKYPGVYVLKRKIRFTTVIVLALAFMFLMVAIQWMWF